MYLTYGKYTTLGGTVDEATFSSIEFDVETTIDWYTFGRLKRMETIPEEVERLAFQLVKLELDKSKFQNPASSADGGVSAGASIASQSNDGVQVTYNVISASEAIKRYDESANKMIRRYLAHTVDALGRPLLYRGLYPNE